MDLTQAQKLVVAMYSDPKLLKLYDDGDKMSSSQTKHDVAHAFSVRDVAIALTAYVDSRSPGKLDDWTKHVVIPAAAFLHDIGRAVNVDDHASAGAKIAVDYLTEAGFDKETVNRVARIVALHRSSSVLKLEMKDPAHAIVVIADKCVGDEDRVRPDKARWLRLLRLVGLAKRSFWANSAHDRVNFSIKSANLMVDGLVGLQDNAGAIVLKLIIDEKVSSAQEIMALYHDRFHSCGKAAQFLHYVFRLEFNGVRYAYDKPSRGWKPINSIQIQLP